MSLSNRPTLHHQNSQKTIFNKSINSQSKQINAMKKVIVVLSFLVVVVANQVSAQGQGTGKVSLQDFHFTTKLSDGLNTVLMPNGKGVIRFFKRGESFSNMTFQDATGKIERLSSNDGSTDGAPTPECKCPMPDACYSTPNKNIGLCMCKPCDLTNGEEYNIVMLLPAVQKVREAAN